MTERERPEPRFNYFSFVCPDARVDDARAILGEIPGVSVNDEGFHTIRMFVDPDEGRAIPVEGTNLEGISPFQARQAIVKSLAEAQIAGYSRSTQIMFADSSRIESRLSPLEEGKIYRPRIEFHEDTLSVGFDHALTASPERLEQEAGMITWFGVHPDHPLYIGLQLEPKHIIKAVADGLASYRDDETLKTEQRALIELGVSRLHDLLNQDN